VILVVDGGRHEVVLKETKEGLTAVVDGAPLAVTVEEVTPGTFVLWQGERPLTFHCVRDGADIHVAWRGTVYHLVEQREGGRNAHRPAGGGLEAPMPGKVIKVSVSVGATVTKGQEVLVVEAMKMENTLRAPRDGTVRAVAVQVGDRVTPGKVLVELA